MTASAASVLRHQALTPKYSLAPADSLAPHNPNPNPNLNPNPIPNPAVGGGAPATPNHLASSSLPGPSEPVVPVPGSRGNPLAPSTPSGTNLFDLAVYSPPDPRLSHHPLDSSLNAPLPSAALFPIPSTPKWNEILTWSIARPSSRLACAPEYLTLCILLVHGPALLDINSSTYRVRRQFPQPGEK